MDTLSYSTRSTLIRIVATSGWEALCALGRRSSGHSAAARLRDGFSLRTAAGSLRAGAASARLRFGRR